MRTNEEEQNETLVKLFALACKAGQESRAFDVCKLMDTTTIQIAIKYASKVRKMQLAQKLGDLACQVQEQEQQEQEDLVSNVDIFESQQHEQNDDDENPILAARLKRSTIGVKSAFEETQLAESRNPFRKETNANKAKSAQDGFVFDGLSSATTKTKNRNALFGSRTKGEKENKVKDDSKPKQTPLKGFKLWLEENRHKLGDGEDESAIGIKGLEMWKMLEKSEKEKYASPRLPVNARKRRNSDSSSDGQVKRSLKSCN